MYSLFSVDDAKRPRLVGTHSHLSRGSRAQSWRLASMPEGKMVKGFCEVVEPEYIKSDIVPLFVQLAQDDQV